MLDLVDFYLGPIAKATGAAVNQGGHYAAEDLVSAEFELASGVRGNGLWCFTAHGAVDRTEIVGSRGRITYATFDDRPILLETPGGAETLTIPHPAHVPAAAHPDRGGRAAWRRRVSEHRRDRRPHVTGDGPAASLGTTKGRHQASGIGAGDQGLGMRD